MDYTEALEYIDGNFTSFQVVGRAAYREGLDAIGQMMSRLEHPQRNYLCVHVAGTNGKGSVAHMLASVLQAAGYRTGLFTSPHLNDFRERMRIDGEPVPQCAVADFVSDNAEKMRELGLSYFEMTAAMAFEWFSEEGVEVAVIETGLGGRLDAPNIVNPVLSVITNIGFDHTDILGATIPEIAFEKAGIIKHGVPVVIGERHPESDAVFVRRAAEADSEILFAQDAYRIVETAHHPDRVRYGVQRLRNGGIQYIDSDLRGDYQARNINTVRGAIHALRHKTQLDISSRAMLEGLAEVATSTGLRGRWQVIADAPFTVLDAAHNAHGLEYVVRQIARQKYERLYMVVGFSADKDLASALSLLPVDAHYIFTQAPSPRALPAGKLAASASSYKLRGEVVATVPEALARAKALATPGDMIFIGGSSFVVAEVV
jgi:dihydrofolate synthase/folylpolyglutamate synthase